MVSDILHRILALVARREVVISDHGYEELTADGILVRDIYESAEDAIVVEEYPTYHKGPCVLVLQRDHQGQPIHVPREKVMSTRRRTKYVLEGLYAAAVDVHWIEYEMGWSPYLSLEDAQKLDEVREALRRGDLKTASQLGRVYQLTPIAV